MEFPPYSPDLTSIENLWSTVAREVNKSSAADATEEQQEAEWSDRAAACPAARDVSELRLRSMQASVSTAGFAPRHTAAALRHAVHPPAHHATGGQQGYESRHHHRHCRPLFCSAVSAGSLPPPPSRFPFEMCQPRMLQFDKVSTTHSLMFVVFVFVCVQPFIC